MSRVLRHAIILVIFLLSCSLLKSEGNFYTVNTANLNVRERPSLQAPVIGVVHEWELVYTECNPVNGWLEIEYCGNIRGYVSADYVSLYIPMEENKEVKQKAEFWDFLHVSSMTLMILIIIGLALTLFTFFRYPIFGIVTFLITCLLELWYLQVTSNPTWFCQPRNVGWLWTIVNFFLFGFFVSMQWHILQEILTVPALHPTHKIFWRIGVIGAVAGLVLMLIFQNAFDSDEADYITLIYQIGFFAYVMYMFMQKKAVLRGLFAYLIYLVGVSASISITISFTNILMIVLICSAGVSALRYGSGSYRGVDDDGNGTFLGRDGHSYDLTRYEQGRSRDQYGDMWRHSHGSMWEKE